VGKATAGRMKKKNLVSKIKGKVSES
jgi:hypothetical protein